MLDETSALVIKQTQALSWGVWSLKNQERGWME